MKPWKTYTYETPQLECFTCELTKSIEEFQYMKLMPRHRHYNCLECEAELRFVTGVNFTSASNISKVPRSLIYKHPEVIESKRIIKSIRNEQ
jgi:hypothetical protein